MRVWPLGTCRQGRCGVIPCVFTPVVTVRGELKHSMTTTKDDGFSLLKRFIEQTLRIQCSNYKEDYIKRRLLSRMRSTSTTTYEEYLKYLHEHPPELENLRNALTINVTEFFRDADVYDLIRKEVLPALFRGRKTTPHLVCRLLNG